jgi:hypothetical protein
MIWLLMRNLDLVLVSRVYNLIDLKALGCDATKCVSSAFGSALSKFVAQRIPAEREEQKHGAKARAARKSRNVQIPEKVKVGAVAGHQIGVELATVV